MPRVDETDVDKQLRQRFATALRRRRMELGMSQDALSARSGIARSYLAEVETLRRNVSLVNIGRIARALDISLSDLFARYSIND